MPITTLKKLELDVARDLRDDFEEWGWDHPDATWRDVLQFATAYGLVTKELRPVSRAAAKILALGQKEFLKGQKERKRRD
jgi:hypothetical protein